MSRTILGSSPAVKELLKMIGIVSKAKTNILIIGESGTGKELVARMIHDSGPLKDKPFVPVNCGAIPETLIESEMFGHRRGSFTGAVADKEGLFEVADGGTLFLDEVGELPLSMQVKLLRVLQEKTLRKVGGTEDIRVDVRIIAATNRDLEAAVAKGTFREDLYYRLNVILIKTPPLRERQGDVKLLADAFVERASKKQGKKLDGYEPDALAALVGYEWPGNVRELENVIERCVTLESGPKISLDVFPPAIQQAARKAGVSKQSGGPAASSASGGSPTLPPADFVSGSLDLEAILAEVEKHYIQAAIAHSGGLNKKTPDLLKVTGRSLRYRMNKLGMSVSEEAGD